MRAEPVQPRVPHDDALIDDLARQGIAYVPFFPLGGFSPLQSSTLSAVADGSWPRRCRSRWLGCCTGRPTSCLIPGTSSVAHLRENLKAADLQLPPQTVAELNSIATNAAKL